MGRLLDELGCEFKVYESVYEPILDQHKHTIIRVDGHKFHKFTKKYFSFPFDIRIPFALYDAAVYVVKRLSKCIVFFCIQSDEISFYIPPTDYFISKKGWQDVFIPYNYRAFKLTSLIASFVTSVFNKSLQSLTEDIDLKNHQLRLYELFEFPKAKFKWDQPNEFACFDARVFQVTSLYDVEKYFTWRRVDAIRNSKNQFSYAFLSHKQTLKLSSNERIKLVAERFNKSYYDLPEIFKVGLPVKVDTNLDTTFGFKHILDFKDPEEILKEA